MVVPSSRAVNRVHRCEKEALTQESCVRAAVVFCQLKERIRVFGVTTLEGDCAEAPLLHRLLHQGVRLVSFVLERRKIRSLGETSLVKRSIICYLMDGQSEFVDRPAVAEAHRQIPIHPRDWHLRCCQIEVGGDLYVNKVGTFRVASRQRLETKSRGSGSSSSTTRTTRESRNGVRHGSSSGPKKSPRLMYVPGALEHERPFLSPLDTGKQHLHWTHMPAKTEQDRRLGTRT